MNRTTEIDELAIKLADDSALSAIDCYCVVVPSTEHKGSEKEQWFDTGDIDNRLADDVRYLELRGLLERHPVNFDWVQLFEEEEVADEAVPV